MHTTLIVLQCGIMILKTCRIYYLLSKLYSQILFKVSVNWLSIIELHCFLKSLQYDAESE